MAKIILIEVSNIELTPMQQNNFGEYSLLHIMGNNTEYSKIYKSSDDVLKIGDKLRLYYEDVKGTKYYYHNVISYDILNDAFVIPLNQDIEVMAMGNKTETKSHVSKFFTVTGLSYYASVRSVNKLSNKYQMDLSIGTETKKELQGKGIKIKNKGDERGDFVTLVSQKYAPKVLDSQLNTTEDSLLIGNGSTVTVQTSVFDWVGPTGTKGKSLNLGTVQIIDLVPYEVKGGLKPTKGGYTSGGGSGGAAGGTGTGSASGGGGSGYSIPPTSIHHIDY